MEEKSEKPEKPIKKKHDIDWDALDEERKHFYLFGRDVSEIPCFRNSFLYGIGSGVGVGLGKVNLIKKN